MSITFSANVSALPTKTSKVWLGEKYGLEEAYFENDPYATLCPETNKHYELVIQPDCDFEFEVNFSNSSFDHILFMIDANEAVKSRSAGGYGNLSIEQLQSFRKKVFFSLNTIKEKHTFETIKDGNFIHCGMDKERIERSLKSILRVIDNAIKHNLSIHWG